MEKERVFIIAKLSNHLSSVARNLIRAVKHANMP